MMDYEETRPRKKISEETRKYLQEFSDATTLHGVRYVGEQNLHIIERLCWLAAIFACSVLCGLEMYKVWTRWQSSPVILSFSHSPVSIASIPFPGITVCPENKVKKSLVDVEQNFTQLEMQLNGSLPFFSSEQQLLAEAISMVCLTKHRDMNFTLPCPVAPTRQHLDIIATKISPQLDDIFMQCVINNVEQDCATLFRPIFTTYGFCYSFNTLDDDELYLDHVGEYPLSLYKKETRVSSTYWDLERGYFNPRTEDDFPRRNGVYAGPRWGLQFILKSPPEDIQQMCSGRNAEIYKVTLQPPEEFPDTYYGSHFYISPGSDNEISLSPSKVTTAPELNTSSYTPQIRGCNFPHEYQLKMFKSYTQMNCVMECERRVYLQNCSCHLHYYPTDRDDATPYCGMDVLATPDVACGDEFLTGIDKIFYDDVEDEVQSSGQQSGATSACGCLPSCTETKYNYHVNQASQRNSFMFQNDSNNYAVVNVYFEASTFFGMHRSELYGITDFIASCGGLLGLFTGFSVISAVEIFYFASLRLACRLRRNQQINYDVQY